MTDTLPKSNLEFEDSGVEAEDTDLETIVDPFDPTLIRINTLPSTVDLLLTRIRHQELDLAPDFQRAAGIWDDKKQSRLIESVLIRIPLPAFYMVATEHDTWQVVDGLQRLTTFKRFVIDEELKLKDLEFLTPLTGLKYSAIPRNFQRRIMETQVTVYVIEEGTPDSVKFNIFRRINTGGVPLNAQEIRHALNQGPVTQYLLDLATSFEFLQATGGRIRTERMEDRECVLRFLAFAMTPYREYRAKDFDSFLSDAMKQINRMSEPERDDLRDRFVRSMWAAYELFGDQAFRKHSDRRLMPINKPLFEAWSVNLDRLNGIQLQTLISRKERLEAECVPLIIYPEFQAAISYSTGDTRKIHVRFGSIERLIQGVIA